MPPRKRPTGAMTVDAARPADPALHLPNFINYLRSTEEKAAAEAR